MKTLVALVIILSGVLVLAWPMLPYLVWHVEVTATSTHPAIEMPHRYTAEFKGVTGAWPLSGIGAEATNEDGSHYVLRYRLWPTLSRSRPNGVELVAMKDMRVSRWQAGRQ